MNILTFKQRVDIALFVINQTSGYVVAIAFFAVVQSVNIAMFFSSIFYKKIMLMLIPEGMVLPLELTIVLVLVAAILGVLAGVVIETGSFFFAINGHPYESFFSAFISGLLSTASYHALILDKSTNPIMIGGLIIFGAYPALFIIFASHRLAIKMKAENVIQSIKDYLSEQAAKLNAAQANPNGSAAKTMQFKRNDSDLDKLLAKVI